MARITGPSMKSPNELSHTSGNAGFHEDMSGIEPAGRSPMVNDGPISTRNRRSRPISGPAQSKINELEYKGT